MTTPPVDHHNAFEQHRARMLGIAYRMLGSASDAEDVLQDAWLRWCAVDPAGVTSTSAYLGTVVTRLCLDAIRLTKRQRQEYPGPWLPEPFDPGSEPARLLERDQTLRLATLRLMEHLSPRERAVYVLREAFGDSFETIAQTLNAQPATCRQWFRRARLRMANTRSPDTAVLDDVPQSSATVEAGSSAALPEHTSPQADLATLLQFADRIQAGDVEGVRSLLAREAIVYADGGGRVSAAIVPIETPERIARVLVHLWQHQADLQLHLCTANGGTVLLMQDGEPFALVSLELREGLVQEIDIVRNPDKLRRVTPGA